MVICPTIHALTCCPYSIDGFLLLLAFLNFGFGTISFQSRLLLLHLKYSEGFEFPGIKYTYQRHPTDRFDTKPIRRRRTICIQVSEVLSISFSTKYPENILSSVQFGRKLLRKLTVKNTAAGSLAFRNSFAFNSSFESLSSACLANVFPIENNLNRIVVGSYEFICAATGI